MKRIVDDKLFDVKTIKSPLEEKFGIPPFSIFDTMLGYWRKRVNEWKSLGIKSEIGRGDNLTFNIGFDVEMSKKNKYGKFGRKNEQATSIFDPVLCELIYTWFMPKNGNKIIDCFACFVVGDIRDKNGCYRNFVGDTINAFKDSGLNYYNEIILVNSAGSLPIRINKQFNSGRKIGKRHQNVLVFFKGNPKNIKDKFGDVVIE